MWGGASERASRKSVVGAKSVARMLWACEGRDAEGKLDDDDDDDDDDRGWRMMKFVGFWHCLAWLLPGDLGLEVSWLVIK
jgi:hypothetical protein